MVEFTTATGFDELELRLFKESTRLLTAELRTPDGVRFAGRLHADVLKKLNDLPDVRHYGQELGRWLFQGEIGSAFLRFSELVAHPSRSVDPKLGLRIRLWLDPDAPELQRVRWEAIAHPGSGEPLSTGAAFSRLMRTGAPQYLFNLERSPRMLVVAANPEGFEPFYTGEIVDIWHKTVASGRSRFIERLELEEARDGSTLEQLERAGEQDYRIVHLMARSEREGKSTIMILADAHGKAERVPVERVTEAMTRIAFHLPSLVFISAPQPPAEEQAPMEQYLGPGLLNRGAQAVVTIEAPMNPIALNEFSFTFYRVLSATGVVDEAVARARARVFATGEWDWTAPVLFTSAQENIQVFQQIGDIALQGTVMGVNISKGV